jgi:hypothetical protein
MSVSTQVGSETQIKEDLILPEFVFRMLFIVGYVVLILQFIVERVFYYGEEVIKNIFKQDNRERLLTFLAILFVVLAVMVALYAGLTSVGSEPSGAY